MQKIKTRQLTMAAVFTALLAVLAQLTIPIQPIPLSFTLFAVFLTGALQRPAKAFLSGCAYLLLGGIGIPVFSGFVGGVGILFGPTGGYKLSYPLMALLIAGAVRLANKRESILQRLLLLAAGMLLALLLCYTLGTLWYMAVADQSAKAALSVCVLPFLGVDLAKLVLACAVVLAVRKTKLFPTI